jgi:hypothetical protein
MWETKSQPAEKKTACDKRVSRETTIVLLALAYQKLGCSGEKISCRIHAAPERRAQSEIWRAIRGPPIASPFLRAPS